MDVTKEVVSSINPNALATIVVLLLSLMFWLSAKTAKFFQSVVHKEYKEIMTMLNKIQEKFISFESQLIDTKSQMKDGINDLKLQISGLVPFSEYHEFSKEIKEELTTLREKIARLEDR